MKASLAAGLWWEALDFSLWNSLKVCDVIISLFVAYFHYWAVTPILIDVHLGRKREGGGCTKLR